jgi:signal transduction histidine kinase
VALRSAAAGDATGHLSEARAMLRRIDDDVDALAWQIRPAMLDDDGFVPALRRYVEDWSARCRVPAEFWADETVDAPGFLTSETETNLYRITQEALNNIAKYAGASSVEVLLTRRGDAAVLLVQDDGNGFDLTEFGSKSVKTMGLVGMRERAGLVGGSFQIESAPGEGTTVYVQVPLGSTRVQGVGLMQSAGS